MLIFKIALAGLAHHNSAAAAAAQAIIFEELLLICRSFCIVEKNTFLK